MPCRNFYRLYASSILLLAISGFARADDQLPVDRSSIWTFNIENDAVAGTDRYYTSGLRIGWTSPTNALPDFISVLGHSVWGDGLQRIAIDISQSLFTPSNTQISPADPTDRPYAGELTGDFSLIQDTARMRSVLGVDLGLVGQGALGEQVQNGFHRLIGQTTNKGWGSQVPNQPLVELFAERTWRLPVAQIGGLEADVLPDLTAGVGNERVYGLGGVLLRIGHGLDADFGAARIRPGLSGSDAYVQTTPVTWYIFAGGDGQLVGYDTTLNGPAFQASRSVSLVPVVGEAEAGLAAIAYGVRLSYTEVVQSAEFHHQRGGLFQFGALTLSAKF
jgi:hypothetical protein